MKVSAVGIPWYLEEDYPVLRELFDDGDSLPATYQDWLKKANGVLKRLEGSGTIVFKAYIEPEKFAAWCRARSLNVDSHARNEFANVLAISEYRKLS